MGEPIFASHTKLYNDAAPYDKDDVDDWYK